VKTDLSSGNSCLSALASCVFPVCDTRADERNGLTISDKLCTDIASPPLFRRNVSKWQCRRLLVLLFCFTKSAGNVWPRNQCHKPPIQQRITDNQMTLPASERAIAKHARQTSRTGDHVYVLG
jgi:hypothetical protein